MPEITLTPEQANIYHAAKGDVMLRLPNGDYAGSIDTSELAIIAEAKRRMAMGRKTIPHEAVPKLFEALQHERERFPGFNKSHLEEFLKKWNAANGYE